jgi:hypothetical protein
MTNALLSLLEEELKELKEPVALLPDFIIEEGRGRGVGEMVSRKGGTRQEEMDLNFNHHKIQVPKIAFLLRGNKYYYQKVLLRGN